MKYLHTNWLTDGNQDLNRTVTISDEEFEELSRFRGFPHETDPWGDAYPEWLDELDERSQVVAPPDVTIVIY